MINKIKTNIQNHYYTYDKNEYLPIFYEGEWANRSEFTEYKVRKVMSAIGGKLTTLLEVMDEKQKNLYKM